MHRDFTDTMLEGAVFIFGLFVGFDLALMNIAILVTLAMHNGLGPLSQRMLWRPSRWQRLSITSMSGLAAPGAW